MQYLDYLQGLLLLVLHPTWGYQVDGILGNHSTGILQCKYIHMVRKKGAVGRAGIKHKEAPLSLEQLVAGLSPYIKKMDSDEILSESSPMLGHLHV